MVEEIVVDRIRASLEPFVGRRALAVDWRTKSVDQKGYSGGIGILTLDSKGVYLAVRTFSDSGEDTIRELRIAEGFEVEIYEDGISPPKVDKRYLF